MAKRRMPEEQLMVLWPGGWAALSRLVLRLPLSSRFRAAMVRRNALTGWGAWVRGDLDVVVVRFAPDYRYDPPSEWLLPGMPTVYHGHAGLRQWAADLHEAWEFVEHMPLEIVDTGPMLAFHCQIRLRARASGIELDTQLGQVFWIERGVIVRESDFGSWDRALQVAGVPR